MAGEICILRGGKAINLRAISTSGIRGIIRTDSQIGYLTLLPIYSADLSFCKLLFYFFSLSQQSDDLSLRGPCNFSVLTSSHFRKKEREMACLGRGTEEFPKTPDCDITFAYLFIYLSLESLKETLTHLSDSRRKNEHTFFVVISFSSLFIQAFWRNNQNFSLFDSDRPTGFFRSVPPFGSPSSPNIFLSSPPAFFELKAARRDAIRSLVRETELNSPVFRPFPSLFLALLSSFEEFSFLRTRFLALSLPLPSRSFCRTRNQREHNRLRKGLFWLVEKWKTREGKPERIIKNNNDALVELRLHKVPYV